MPSWTSGFRNAGCAIWLQGDLVVDYIPRSDVVSLYWQYYWYGRGRARNFRLHGRNLKLRQLIPLMVAPALALSLLAPINYWAAAPALLWLTCVFLAGLVLGLRRRRWCEAASGLPAAVMHLAWSAGFIQQSFISWLKPTPSPSAIAQRAVDVV